MLGSFLPASNLNPSSPERCAELTMLRQALPLARQAVRRPIGPGCRTQWPGMRLDQNILQVELLQSLELGFGTDSKLCRGPLRIEETRTQIQSLASTILTPSFFLELRVPLQPSLNLLHLGLCYPPHLCNLHRLHLLPTLPYRLKMSPLCLQPRLEARLRQHHLPRCLQGPVQLPFLQQLHHRKSLL